MVQQITNLTRKKSLGTNSDITAPVEFESLKKIREKSIGVQDVVGLKKHVRYNSIGAERNRNYLDRIVFLPDSNFYAWWSVLILFFAVFEFVAYPFGASVYFPSEMTSFMIILYIS